MFGHTSVHTFVDPLDMDLESVDPLAITPPPVVADTRACVATAINTVSYATQTGNDDTASIGLCPIVKLDEATVVDEQEIHHSVPEFSGALVDSASSVTYVNRKFLNHLPKGSYKVLKKNMAIHINMIASSTAELRADLINLSLSINGFTLNFNALVMTDEIADKPAVCYHVLMEYSKKIPRYSPYDQPYNHLLAFHEQFRIDILFGMPYTWKIIQDSRPVEADSDGLYLLKTIFGTIPSGALTKRCACPSTAVSFLTASENLAAVMEKMMTLEEFHNDKESLLSHDELAAVEFLEKHTFYNEEGQFYTSRICWKDGKPPPFKGTYAQAVRRWYAMERQLLRRPDSATEEVFQSVQQHIDSGCYVPVPDEQLPWYTDPNNTNIFVLAPRVVWREGHESHSCRFCLDASAKSSNGLSLNSQLHKGPCQLKNLIVLQLRWRKGLYCWTTDLSKMFLSIRISPEDQDYQLFLFRRPNSKEKLRLYKSTRCTFGLRSSPFCATFVLTTHAKKILSDKSLPESHHRAARLILDSIYMDDVLASAQSIQEARETTDSFEIIMSLAGFRAAKYRASHPDIIAHLPPEKHAKQSLDQLGHAYLFSDKDHALISPGAFKSLGQLYSAESDSYMFGGFTDLLETLKTHSGHTKRQVAACLATLAFDLVGIRGPFVLNFRILLKKIMIADKQAGRPNDKKSWDRLLDDDEQAEFNNLLEQIPLLDKVTLPRQLSFHLTHELFAYSDASNNGLACCFYLRTYDTETNKILVQFVHGKSKVRPISTDALDDSIPRLELQAAALLGKQFDHLKEAFGIRGEQCKAYTDSACVYFWTRANVGNLCPFQHNRVVTLRQQGFTNWRYVSSECNPADEGAKGLAAEQLLPESNSRWIRGAPWLWHPSQTWPSDVPGNKSKSDPAYLKGYRKSCIVETLRVTVIGTESCKFHADTAKIFDSTRDYSKLLTRISVWLVYIDYLRKRRLRSTRSKPVTILTLSEAHQRAKLLFFSYVQQVYFLDEFYCLAANEKLDPDSTLIRYNPYLDTIRGVKLIRSNSRLVNLPGGEYFKRPILMPKFSHNDHQNWAKCYAQHFHEKMFHCTTETLYFFLRQTVVFLGGKASIKKIVRYCIKCNKRDPAKNVNSPQMAPLPATRIDIDTYPPMSSVSLDHAGPFVIKGQVWNSKSHTNLRGTLPKQHKCYILLIACQVSRFVTGILVPGLSLDNFILALQQAFGCHGWPVRVHSDCFSTNKAGDRLLLKLFADNRQKLERFAVENEFVWDFSVPCTPHTHGSIEALVKLTKRALYENLKSTLYTFFEMQSNLSHCMLSINARPLSATTSGPDSSFEAITPFSILYGRHPNQLSLANVSTYIDSDYAKLWEERQASNRRFISQFKRDYYDKILHRVFWRENKPVNLQAGDFLVIAEDNDLIKKSDYPICRILELLPGKDGVIRTAKVQMADGLYRVTHKPGKNGKKRTLIKAPTSKVIHLAQARRLEGLSMLTRNPENGKNEVSTLHGHMTLGNNHSNLSGFNQLGCIFITD